MYVAIPQENKKVGYIGNEKATLTHVRCEGPFCSSALPAPHRKRITAGTDSCLVLPPPTDLPAPKRGTFGPVVGKRPMPQVFSFTTWWNEKGTRQYMTMDYFPEMKTWRVQVDVPLAVNIYHRSGELLEPYDLHVGARVDCLGRMVTLHQASLDVLNWLDDQAQVLIKKKLELEDEVSKFIHVRRTTIQQTSMKLNNFAANPVRAQGGRLNLRGLWNEVIYLQQELHFYRPPSSPHYEGKEEDGDEEEDLSGQDVADTLLDVENKERELGEGGAEASAEDGTGPDPETAVDPETEPN
mmetsp:Transcript_20930/g.35071  ORF Transcript_20930/g.35071 Transcript_20930/m.35071 type:complete len:297 (-) Transcript_20930:69-959(-)|eukprot:CAMPEP_0198201786 /NCGR_PEP_ID=MMETSP1445-20131203/4798_1 /TAXON_ID=36898 /ORGANISM="Pyramimonas sp., Strain CCMP2087" /LENGTH=296 /DNA_ID=CAMNT_0043872387 /DNA_START=391 /DNA_END=1281 /DNA_ORIENTATION=-